jgi:uncharacterized repeat protein (TIGR03803 family)
VTDVHDFVAGAEGSYVQPLVRGNDGNLYGFTALGTESGSSTFFRFSPATNTVTVLAKTVGFFNPYPPVVGSDGSFYINVQYEPDVRAGSIYRMTPAGVVTRFHQFSEFTSPAFNLTIDANGTLYGAISNGGIFNQGSIFKVDLAGNFSTLYSFSNRYLGDLPASGLIEGLDGNFYGTTETGGVLNLGTVFRMQPDGTLTTVVDFIGENGAAPQAALLLAKDGNLYGTTSAGGTQGLGTVFRVTPGGTLTTLLSFLGENGSKPHAPLIEATDGDLYGTTVDGGAFDAGTVYKISTAGLLTTLVSFDGSDATHPWGGLIQGKDGNFYGLTDGGSVASLFTFVTATAYRVATDGSLATLHTFQGDERQGFQTELVQRPDGNFYGISSNGTLFRLTPFGGLTTVTRLPAGAYIRPPSLTLGDDGDLYTGLGASFYDGTPARLVRVTPNGLVFTLATLDSTEGALHGKLLQASDRTFYGTTAYLTGNGGGEIFRAHLLAPTITAVSPSSAPVGSDVVITGAAFTGTTAVLFRGVPASAFNIDSDSEITATVPPGRALDSIVVQTPTGSAVFPANSATPGKLLNISTRANVGTGDDVLIGGFIIQGTVPKKVIVRATGPSLKAQGVPVLGTLSDPKLEIHSGTGAIVASNDNWSDSAEKQPIIDSGVAPSDPHEAAVVATLAPGNYTAVLSGVGGTSGIALVELYDLDQANGRLANISTRGRVEVGDQVMIGGFILGGTAPSQVVVRALGPSLSYGNSPVYDTLSDLELELRDAQGFIMATNDDWEDSVNRQAIKDANLAPTEPAESVIDATLPAGNYTAIVRGVYETSGVGLVEVYKLE